MKHGKAQSRKDDDADDDDDSCLVVILVNRCGEGKLKAR